MNADDPMFRLTVQTWVLGLDQPWVEVKVRVGDVLRDVWLRTACVATIEPMGPAPEGDAIDLLVTTTAGAAFDVVLPSL